MNDDLLYDWALYYFHSEEFDRGLPHKIVRGIARVWPGARGVSDDRARYLRRLLMLKAEKGPERRHCQRLTHDGIQALLRDLGRGTGLPPPPPPTAPGIDAVAYL